MFHCKRATETQGLTLKTPKWMQFCFTPFFTVIKQPLYFGEMVPQTTCAVSQSQKTSGNNYTQEIRWQKIMTRLSLFINEASWFITHLTSIYPLEENIFKHLSYPKKKAVWGTIFPQLCIKRLHIDCMVETIVNNIFCLNDKKGLVCPRQSQ